MLNFVFISAIVFALGVSTRSFAQGTSATAGTVTANPANASDGIHDETQLGITIISGNTNSQSYTIGEIASYGWDSNIVKGTLHYLNTTANGTNTALLWDSMGRYERQLSPNLGAFADQVVESDVFSGVVQRNSTDLGGQYSFWNRSDTDKLVTEFGYRYITTQYTTNLPNSNVPTTVNHSLRLYAEIDKAISSTTTGRLWAEYVPSLSNSNDWLFNFEPSATVLISKILSLKIAYLYKYHNLIPPNLTVGSDTAFTTTLVAKF